MLRSTQRKEATKSMRAYMKYCNGFVLYALQLIVSSKMGCPNTNPARRCAQSAPHEGEGRGRKGREQSIDWCETAVCLQAVQKCFKDCTQLQSLSVALMSQLSSHALPADEHNGGQTVEVDTVASGATLQSLDLTGCGGIPTSALRGVLSKCNLQTCVRATRAVHIPSHAFAAVGAGSEGGCARVGCVCVDI